MIPVLVRARQPHVYEAHLGPHVLERRQRSPYNECTVIIINLPL